MITTVLAFLITIFFAMNIGASGAAASMGIAYGSGVIRRKRLVLVISEVGVFWGAVIGGEAVVKTIGSGIIAPSILDINIALVILAAAMITLFIAM